MLWVHGEALCAHRSILAAHSPYFKVMFSGKFSEREQVDLDLSQSVAKLEVLLPIVDFMYTGEVTLTADTVEHILSAANMFMLDPVKKHCAEYLLTNLSVINCLYTWRLADLYALPELGQICMALARSRFRDFIQYQKDTLTLPVDFIQVLHTEGVLDFLDHMELRHVLTRWREYLQSQRKGDTVGSLFANCKTSQQHALSALEDIMPEEQSQPETSHWEEANCIDTQSAKEQDYRIDATKYPADEETVYTSLVATIFPSKPYVTENCQTQLHFYIPALDRWYTKDLAMESTIAAKIQRFMGCLDTTLVFTCGYDEALLCTYTSSDSGHWQHVTPMRTCRQEGFTDLVDCQYLFAVFDKKLFCFIVSVQTTSDRSSPCLQSEVVVLDGQQWASIFTTSERILCVAPKRNVNVAVARHGNSLYVLSSFMAEILWYRISKSEWGYQISYLQPPDSCLVLHNPRYELTAFESTVVLRTGVSEEFAIFDILDESWSYRASCRYRLPEHFIVSLIDQDQVPHTGIVPVDISLVPPPDVDDGGGAEDIPSYNHAFYHVEVVAPYISRFWRGIADLSDPESLCWSECSPPPTEKLRKWTASVVVTPNLHRFLTPAKYADKSEEYGQSPYAYHVITGHKGHYRAHNAMLLRDQFPPDPFMPYFDPVCRQWQNE